MQKTPLFESLRSLVVTVRGSGTRAMGDTLLGRSETSTASTGPGTSAREWLDGLSEQLAATGADGEDAVALIVEVEGDLVCHLGGITRGADDGGLLDAAVEVDPLRSGLTANCHRLASSVQLDGAHRVAMPEARDRETHAAAGGAEPRTGVKCSRVMKLTVGCSAVRKNAADRRWASRFEFPVITDMPSTVSSAIVVPQRRFGPCVLSG